MEKLLTKNIHLPDSHKIETYRATGGYKALAKALDAATRPEERARGQVPSTKGVIEGA